MRSLRQPHPAAKTLFGGLNGRAQLRRAIEHGPRPRDIRRAGSRELRCQLDRLARLR